MQGRRVIKFEHCVSGSSSFMHSGASSVPREIILHTQFSQLGPLTLLLGKEARHTSLVLLLSTCLNIRENDNGPANTFLLA